MTSTTSSLLFIRTTMWQVLTHSPNWCKMLSLQQEMFVLLFLSFSFFFSCSYSAWSWCFQLSWSDGKRTIFDWIEVWSRRWQVALLPLQLGMPRSAAFSAWNCSHVTSSSSWIGLDSLLHFFNCIIFFLSQVIWIWDLVDERKKKNGNGGMEYLKEGVFSL